MKRETLRFWENEWKRGKGITSCWYVLLGRIKGKNLDIGCGDWKHYDLSSSEYSVGMDVSLNAFKRAKKNKIEKTSYDLVRASAEKLPFKDGSFERVSMIETLTLIGKDYGKVLDEVARVTKDNFVFTVTHKEIDNDILKNSVKGVEKVTFNEEEITELLKERGLKIEELDAYTEEQCENFFRTVYDPSYANMLNDRKVLMIISARKI